MTVDIVTDMSPIEQTLVELLSTAGPIRGTSQVGYALWPDRKMQPQGAALAAGKVLRRLLDKGYVRGYPDHQLSRYEVTERGRAALARG